MPFLSWSELYSPPCWGHFFHMAIVHFMEKVMYLQAISTYAEVHNISGIVIWKWSEVARILGVPHRLTACWSHRCWSVVETKGEREPAFASSPHGPWETVLFGGYSETVQSGRSGSTPRSTSGGPRPGGSPRSTWSSPGSRDVSRLHFSESESSLKDSSPSLNCMHQLCWIFMSFAWKEKMFCSRAKSPAAPAMTLWKRFVRSGALCTAMYMQDDLCD